MNKNNTDAHPAIQRLRRAPPDPFHWARAAKAASRATAVLSAWGGPGRDAKRDLEAFGALSAFAKEACEMDQHVTTLACVMLWGHALKDAGLGHKEWGLVVERAVEVLDEGPRGRVRAALVSARA